MTEIKIEIRVIMYADAIKSIESIEKIKRDFLKFQMNCEVQSLPVTFMAQPISIQGKSNSVPFAKYYSISVAGNIDMETELESDFMFNEEKECGDDLCNVYFSDIKPIIGSYIMAFVLAYPEIDISPCRTFVYFNGEEYRHENFFDEDCIVDESRALLHEHITIQQAWNWIANNSNLCKRKSDTPPALAALSYVLNRQYPEVLMYSIIGLESIFTAKESRNTNYLLQNRITHLFPSVTKTDIKNMYQLRSEFVHGNKRIGILYSIDDQIENEEDYKNNAMLSAALLIESIRILIAHNALGIEFQQTISHTYIPC